MSSIRTIRVLLCIRVTTAALIPGDDWYHLMKEMAESADLPPSDHGEISQYDHMGTYSTQSDVDWIHEMLLMDTDPCKGMSDHLTQASVAQNIQEAHDVQSAQTPIQVPRSYHGPPHSPAYESGRSLNSLIMDTSTNTMVASSMGIYVTPGSEDQRRKRLRNWQSVLTGLEGQDLNPLPSHFDQGILEHDHPRASQMNQRGSLYTKMQKNEGRQHKLAQNGEYTSADNQGQGICNEITHYPECSMADFRPHPMNREIQLNSPRHTVDQYTSGQATEGQQNHTSKLLKNKAQENPPEIVQILSGIDLKNHIMEILRPHFPQTHPENSYDIKPPNEPLNLQSHKTLKLQCEDQIKPYRAFYKDRMVELYQKFEAPTNSPVVNKIGDWDFFMVKIKQANPHTSDLMALIIPSTVEGKWYTNSRLYSIFTSIQRWMTKVHSLLWKQLKGDISPQADHQMMMLWFFQEVFNPQYGIPILGGEYIQNWINAQFGPVQIWLMKLLQGKQSTHTTSVAISATWFKKTAPEQWQMRFKDDSCFWEFVNALFNTNIHSVEKQLRQLSKFDQALAKFIYKPPQNSGVWNLGIRDFQIRSRPCNIQMIGKPPTSKAKASIKMLETQARIHGFSKQASSILKRTWKTTNLYSPDHLTDFKEYFSKEAASYIPNEGQLRTEEFG
ncbi:hypothetical protein Pst134EA_022480 [Puccinia striiformis f. sp. tritici]|nr:hypothetical protein Pst134EA_022480 [Puccinia striiformis f. sp. tritici]KAH9454993.1 hypothetical protein Pst134EA_022480 [Puccinia striiformis f. sp. tritici]